MTDRFHGQTRRWYCDVYKRRNILKDDPNIYQADILPEEGGDHHGIGKTASEAMLNAAMHWHMHPRKERGE